jgi:hypothetical protein
MDAPFAFAGAFDRGSQRAHGFARIDNVLALKETADAGLANRERAENQRPMRDRFVAGDAQPAAQRARAARGQRGGRCFSHGVITP